MLGAKDFLGYVAGLYAGVMPPPRPTSALHAECSRGGVCEMGFV